MPLKLLTHIDLPPHAGDGGFDHAAIDARTDLLYVAHTANDAVDVIDCANNVYLRSIPGLTGVAGVLVSERPALVFTSNRGEDTAGIFDPDAEAKLVKVPVGVRPNGLAFDPGRGTLIAANVGDPARAGSHTLSVVDVAARALRGAVPVSGRTRWAIYDRLTDAFFVNISDPPRIVVLAAADPARIARTYEVPAKGPHGLDIDPATGRLFCACDDGQLVTLDGRTGRVLGALPLSGSPDVIFLDVDRARLYVAMGDPGVIDVIDTAAMARRETVPTEAGAHTTALDTRRRRLHVFLPRTHRAAVFADE